MHKAVYQHRDKKLRFRYKCHISVLDGYWYMRMREIGC
jgi:hypothetical protein